MAVDVKKRLQNLENALFLDEDNLPDGFFIFVHDDTRAGGGRQLPVLGWRHERAGDILRMPGESDESLRQRAIDAAQPHLTHRLSIPAFISVTE